MDEVSYLEVNSGLCCGAFLVGHQSIYIVLFFSCFFCFFLFCFFQAEDGIRDLVRSRGLGDVYKRQAYLVAAVLLLMLGSALGLLPLRNALRAALGLSTQGLSLIHI